ncbi:hypothetical protein WA1_15620 [Scytonema hofmannii PCC 7110]|uniref:Uncharacterized protein n=1 Tax=Scytonema hofmannii PCC 7110 TaxID=128403 RepID=A0A139X9X4_9CYAN|nr:hypothetical protein [Scytonema hofmannii]KYC41491.1 hypothetical protein WA1_15620 [Scytonema hofmannii PCC 7110]
MPDRVEIIVITKSSLRSCAGLEHLLNAFESIKELTPTHWGTDERAPNPYDRNDLLATVSAFKSDFNMPSLHRRQAPRYKAYFSASDRGLNYVSVEFGSSLQNKDLHRVFLLGDAIAAQLEAEFGIVHPVWLEGSQEYCASGKITASELQKYGPSPVCARTWFGSHLVQLISSKRLFLSGAIIHNTPWGGVQLDLVQHPWKSDLETLSNRQRSVMKHLQPSGVFGDYTQFLNYQPGSNWIPILDKISHKVG